MSCGVSHEFICMLDIKADFKIFPTTFNKQAGPPGLAIAALAFRSRGPGDRPWISGGGGGEGRRPRGLEQAEYLIANHQAEGSRPVPRS